MLRNTRRRRRRRRLLSLPQNSNPVKHARSTFFRILSLSLPAAACRQPCPAGWRQAAQILTPTFLAAAGEATREKKCYRQKVVERRRPMSSLRPI